MTRRDRANQSNRMERMARYLRQHPNATTDQLAALLDVSPRTVYRYQRQMQDAGDASERPDPRAPARQWRHLTALDALVADGALLCQNSLHPDRSQILSAFRRHATAAEPRDIEDGMRYERDPLMLTADMHRHLVLLRSAICQRRKVHLQLIDLDNTSTVAMVVSPFHAGDDTGMWSLIGFGEQIGRHIHMPIASIARASVLSDRFRMPYRFVGPEAARNLPVDVRLLPYVTCICTPEAAHVLARSLPDRLISLTGETGGMYRCVVRAYGADELTWWVLAWQGAVQVLEPLRVREAVRLAAAAIHAAHV